MGRLLMLIAAFVAGASSYVYTCNEAKRMMESGDVLIDATRACVVLPAAVKFPFNDDPYTWYLYNTYVVDTNSTMQWEIAGLQERDTLCVDGVGPWKIRSDDVDQFKCSSAKYQYAEIIFLFTTEEPNIVRADTAPNTAKFGQGTHVFVAPEGSLLIEKKSIADGKETTLQLYSGAGADENEEKFALMPEKFVAGTSTVIIGPVTTLEIEDDITVELTLTSFQDTQFISAQPGFSFSLMTTGRANDLQSSRPSILVSTAYDINDDAFAYDSISITGTVMMEDDVATVLSIDCYNKEKVSHTVADIAQTKDVVINEDCSSLDITYKGSLTADDIGRSIEVIYLRIESNSDPVLLHSSTAPPEPAVTEKTRRTPPPTSPETTHSTASRPTTTSRLPTSTTTKTVQTTTSASGISIVPAALVVALLNLF